MEKPRHCEGNLYDLMLCCWNENPKERPNFKKIFSRLQEIAKKGENYIDLDAIFSDVDPNDFSYGYSKKTQNIMLILYILFVKLRHLIKKLFIKNL